MSHWISWPPLVSRSVLSDASGASSSWSTTILDQSRSAKAWTVFLYCGCSAAGCGQCSTPWQSGSAVLLGSLAVQCSLAAGATQCRNSGNCIECWKVPVQWWKEPLQNWEVPLKCLTAESASKVLERAVAGMESASTVLESTILVIVQYWKVPVQC